MKQGIWAGSDEWRGRPNETDLQNGSGSGPMTPQVMIFGESNLGGKGQCLE